MTPHDAELIQRLYQPTSSSMATHLPDIGESLATALSELGRNPTAAQCDAMLHRLQSAGHAVARLRASLIAEAGQ